jgi:peptidoglycan/xylan/chitin deacetylase (PgdA/CDA1 family)
MAGGKSQWFRYGLSALWFSGVARALAPLLAGRGAILMLHRVQPARAADEFAPNARLSITPEYLDALLTSLRRDGIDVVQLDEAVARLTRATARRFVCFTLDDGYRDNLSHALPVFRRHGAPFTVYVTTGFAERTHAAWWCVLEHVVARASQVRWLGPSGEQQFDTSDRGGKERAFAALSECFMALPVAEVGPALAQLTAAHGLELAALTGADFCDWAQVRALHAGGAAIGCHTVNHPVLARESLATARHELSAARVTLERELGGAAGATHLAYPYGTREHAGAREFALARELGFATATTTRKGALFPEHAAHLTALPRVELTPSFADSTHYVRTILSGLPLLAWNRGRRGVIQ